MTLTSASPLICAPHTPMRPARVSWFDMLHVVLIAFYVSFAGIFWIGGISYVLIANLKIALFLAIVAMGLAKRPQYSALQRGLVIWLMICAAAAFVTNLATGTASDAVEGARNFAEPALWLVALIGVSASAYRLLFRLLIVGLVGFAVVALYPVFAFAGVAPNLEPPAGFISPSGVDVDTASFQAAISVVAGGFNGSRTGWGSTIAQSALLLVAIIVMARRVSTRQLILSLIVMATAIVSIVVTGARGGSLSLLLLGIYALLGRLNLSPPQRSGVIFFGILGIVLVTIVGFSIALPEDYFRGFVRNGSTFQILNAATTGRVDTYIGALNNFIQSPIYGVGSERSQIMLGSGEYLLPHNVWLRFLSESGLVVFVPVIVVTAKLVSALITRMRALKLAPALVRERLPDTSLVVICGFILAFSEPAVIFGSMNANIPFWTAMWVLTIPFVVRQAGAAGAPDSTER